MPVVDVVLGALVVPKGVKDLHGHCLGEVHCFHWLEAERLVLSVAISTPIGIPAVSIFVRPAPPRKRSKYRGGKYKKADGSKLRTAARTAVTMAPPQSRRAIPSS